MQLRRGPPRVSAPDAPTPALRLVKAPSGPARASRGGRRWAWVDSYSIRVVAGILLLSSPSVNANLVASIASHPAFEALQVSDVRGNVVATTRAVVLSNTPTGADFAHSLSVETLGPIGIGQVGLDWLMTVPILGPDEKPQGVVVGDLTVTALGRLLNPYGLDNPTKDQETHLVNAQHLLLYSSDWSTAADDALLLNDGALKLVAEGAIFDQAMKSGPGAAQITDYRNHQVLAGYEPIPNLGWVVIASTETSSALASANAQGIRTSLLQALSTVLLIIFGVVLAVYTTRPIGKLSRAAAMVEAGDLTARVNL